MKVFNLEEGRHEGGANGEGGVIKKPHQLNLRFLELLEHPEAKVADYNYELDVGALLLHALHAKVTPPNLLAKPRPSPRSERLLDEGLGVAVSAVGGRERGGGSLCPVQLFLPPCFLFFHFIYFFIETLPRTLR
eukprot:TRINITY_DN27691_c0_g1_i1.p1 TRINITY_DN27691_c0_g1~~TRINITY_DN27691_c0_g1_i1.p1  ORF type:complete len:134 (-),score=7.42 TRINITY_DN27691_c0_g1_i1:12-413(-)